MFRRTFVKLSFVAMATAQMLLGAPILAGAQVSTETYVSPSYGYSLTYDASWEVQSELSDAMADSIHLSNETSYMLFVGTDLFGGNAEDCVAGTIDQVMSAPSYSNVQLVTDVQGNPMAAGDATQAFAVYEFLHTSEDGAQEARTLDTECVTLVPGQATLAIVQMVPTAAYNAEMTARETLLTGLILPPVTGDDDVQVCADGSQPSGGGKGGKGGTSVFGEDGHDGADGIGTCA